MTTIEDYIVSLQMFLKHDRYNTFVLLALFARRLIDFASILKIFVFKNGGRNVSWPRAGYLAVETQRTGSRLGTGKGVTQN